MKVYQRLASFILAFFLLICFSTVGYAFDKNENTQSNEQQNQEQDPLTIAYNKAKIAIESSNLPQELKERMLKHNDDLYNLAQGMNHFDSVLFVTPTNANQKPINVEMSLKYNTFVYGEPSGPHPSMIGKTDEPWILGEDITGQRQVTNKYHPPLIDNDTPMSERDWIITNDAITQSIISGKVMSLGEFISLYPEIQADFDISPSTMLNIYSTYVYVSGLSFSQRKQLNDYYLGILEKRAKELGVDMGDISKFKINGPGDLGILRYLTIFDLPSSTSAGTAVMYYMLGDRKIRLTLVADDFESFRRIFYNDEEWEEKQKQTALELTPDTFDAYVEIKVEAPEFRVEGLWDQTKPGQRSIKSGYAMWFSSGGNNKNGEPIKINVTTVEYQQLNPYEGKTTLTSSALHSDLLRKIDFSLTTNLRRVGYDGMWFNGFNKNKFTKSIGQTKQTQHRVIESATSSVDDTKPMPEESSPGFIRVKDKTLLLRAEVWTYNGDQIYYPPSELAGVVKGPHKLNVNPSNLWVEREVVRRTYITTRVYVYDYYVEGLEDPIEIELYTYRPSTETMVYKGTRTKEDVIEERETVWDLTYNGVVYKTVKTEPWEKRTTFTRKKVFASEIGMPIYRIVKTTTITFTPPQAGDIGSMPNSLRFYTDVDEPNGSKYVRLDIPAISLGRIVVPGRSYISSFTINGVMYDDVHSWAEAVSGY